MRATVIVIPVVDRMHRIEPILQNLREATPEPYRVHWVIDDLSEMARLLARNGQDFTCLFPTGNYARKINVGAAGSDEPLIFCGADDLNFHPGWLSAIHEELDKGAEVVGTCDGAPRQDSGMHSTHSLVTRRYMLEQGTIDEPGKVMCELYPHDWCDDELVATAKARGVYRHAFGSMVEHMHWTYGKSTKDASYERTHPLGEAGRPIFMRRRRLWEALNAAIG